MTALVAQRHRLASLGVSESQNMWAPKTPDFLAIADAIYDIRSPESVWLGSAFRTLQASMPGAEQGVMCIARQGADGLAIDRGWGSLPGLFDEAIRFLASQKADYIPRRIANPVATDWQMLGPEADALAHGSYRLEKGLGRDTLVMLSGDADGSATLFGAFVEERADDRWAPALVDAWEQVSLHLTSAARLRTAVARGAARIEAVLDLDGKLLDAEGAAVAQRELLRTHVRRVARSRSRHRDVPAPLEARAPSFDARWTLVDQFDADGRQFIVAYAIDDPQQGNGARLSPQERRVAEQLAAGASFKRIAYALGLSPGTVANYAHRACAKLGVSGRVALAHAMRR